MPNQCTITEPNCLSNYTLKYHIVKPIARAGNATSPASQFGPDITQLTVCTVNGLLSILYTL